MCAYSRHGSGDNQPNVQKSKIQSYSVEHCTCACMFTASDCVLMKLQVVAYLLEVLLSDLSA